MLVHMVLCDARLLLLCVLRASKIFKMHLVGRPSSSGMFSSFSEIKLLVPQLKTLFGASQTLSFEIQITINIIIHNLTPQTSQEF
jgi:hypothetical protein